ncbi:MAG: acyl-[acyl-carrier-protein] thioesterase [Sphaerochaetaceae bacterium]
MTIEQGIAQQSFLLRAADVDPWYSARLDTYFSLMQESAGMHAYSMNMGIPHLREKKMTWVVTRTVMNIHSYAQWPAKMRVETWAQKPWKFYFPRGCRTYEQQTNRLLFESMTLWLIIDSENYHIIKPASVDNGMFSQCTRFVDPKMEKRKIFSPELYSTVEKKPTCIAYNDTDSNFHVNNVSYVKFILSSLPFSILDDYQASSIDITYSKQAFRNDRISVHTGYPGKEEMRKDMFTLDHQIVKEDDKGEITVLCSAQTIWRRRVSDQ